MTPALEKINQASVEDAESMFRDCCGSSAWSKRMAGSRPFANESEVMESADFIWKRLETSDRLEAFAAHPMIGESKAAANQPAKSADWSKGEQSGVDSADELLKSELAVANQEYFDKFGFIFIVCATGKSADEMLQMCRSRLGNDRETEIAIAANEQQKITGIRLRKLLSA
jgi:OHCU decarboxylase